MRVSKTTSADATETMLTVLRVAATVTFSLGVGALFYCEECANSVLAICSSTILTA